MGIERVIVAVFPPLYCLNTGYRAAVASIETAPLGWKYEVQRYRTVTLMLKEVSLSLNMWSKISSPMNLVLTQVHAVQFPAAVGTSDGFPNSRL
jgi:hypothetical protein